MFWNRDPKPSSHEARLNAAAAIEGAALSIFEQATLDLEAAANEYRLLADDAQNASNDALLVAAQAGNRAAHATKRAVKISEWIK